MSVNHSQEGSNVEDMGFEIVNTQRTPRLSHHALQRKNNLKPSEYPV